MSPKTHVFAHLLPSWRAVDSLGDGVSLEEVGYCWVSLEVDSLAQLSVHSPHAPASQCFPSMTDCVPSNCEPKHKVNFLTCVAFCQIFGRAARKAGDKTSLTLHPRVACSKALSCTDLCHMRTRCERAQDLHDGEEV